jgi:hypothetical protein
MGFPGRGTVTQPGREDKDLVREPLQTGCGKHKSLASACSWEEQN